MLIPDILLFPFLTLKKVLLMLTFVFFFSQADERRPSTGSSLYHTLYSSSSNSSESGSDESESDGEDEEEEVESGEGTGDESESESEEETESESEDDTRQVIDKEQQELEVNMGVEQEIDKDSKMEVVHMEKHQGNGTKWFFSNRSLEICFIGTYLL